MREASRVANDSADVTAPITQPGPWSSSALPGDEREK
jgi:hypothetical protein